MMGTLKACLLVIFTAIGVQILPNVLKSPVPDNKVYGSCTKEFSSVEDAYRSNFRSGLERGSAMSVYYRGEAVCDMWGGYADESILRPWQQDTLGILFSSTKGIAAMALLKLYDSGLLDYSKPVSHYWPEFGKNGKESMTVEQLASHAGGLAAIDIPMTYDHMLNDPEYMSKAFEDQVPNWPPGTEHGYHALTIGPIIDQLVRRIDEKHRSLQQFFNEDIAKPYDIDFFIGTPLSEHHRTSRWMGMGPLDLLSTLFNSPSNFMLMYYISGGDELGTQAFKNPSPNCSKEIDGNDVYFNWPESRVVPQASTNGHGTARSVAKLYGMIANKGRLPNYKEPFLKPSSVDLFNTPLRSGTDKIIHFNITWGYGVAHAYNEEDQSKHRIGTSGYGGQMAFADVGNNFAYGYVTNYPVFAILEDDDQRTVSVRKAIYDSIDKIRSSG